MNLEIHIRQFREEIGQILEWIQSVRLAGLNHAVGLYMSVDFSLK